MAQDRHLYRRLVRWSSCGGWEEKGERHQRKRKSLSGVEGESADGVYRGAPASPQHWWAGTEGENTIILEREGRGTVWRGIQHQTPDLRISSAAARAFRT